MLTIRFTRIGKRKHPQYRVIISEKQRDTRDRFLELLGHYNPHTKEAVLKADRIKHWVSKGATTSATVFNLLVSKGILSGAKRRVVRISKKRSAALAEKRKGEGAASGPGETAPPPDAAVPESVAEAH